MIIRKVKKLPPRFEPGAAVTSPQTLGEAEMRLADGSRLLRMPGNGETLYSKSPPGGDVHPWFTTPIWFDALETAPKSSGGLGPRGGGAQPTVCAPGGWSAMVEPGFVNGVDPLIFGAPEIKIKDAKASEDRTAYQFGEKTKNSSKESRVPGLLDRVRVPLNGFKPFYGRSGQIVEHFKKFGFDPSKLKSVEASGAGGASPVIDATNLFSAGSSPWLGFCDIYLATARPGYDLETQMGAFPLTAIEYAVQFNDDALRTYGTRSRLMTGEMPKTPTPAENAAARLMGKPMEDEGQDFIKISTVYILKTGEWGGDPEQVALTGQNETAFVQHHCFWNLEHRARNRNPVNLPSLNAGLMFLPLVGRYTFAPVFTANVFESMLNEIISAGLNAAQNAGKYWSV